MKDERFMEAVSRIVNRDQRYPLDSYEFISDAVTYTVKKLNRSKKPRSERHVSGHELVRGVAEYALEQFGPLAGNVLADWKLNSGAAIGDVVFNLIAENLLYASEKDSLEDFNCSDALLEGILGSTVAAAPAISAPKTKPTIIIE